MLVKVTVKYDGSHYYGWQTQKPGIKKYKTIEEIINKRVSILNKRKTEVVASGRTDRGVHALGQVFHFENDHNIPVKRLANALNNALPDDIEIIKVEEVADDFHARFSAKSKEYHYYLNMGEFNLFEKDYITQYNKPLNTDLMKAASQIFVGTHNFQAFNTTPLTEKRNQVRTIFKLDVIVDGDIVIFKIVGNSFLRHMVRMIVGMLVYVGNGRYGLEDIENLLKLKNCKNVPYNTKPNGLYLVRVSY